MDTVMYRLQINMFGPLEQHLFKWVVFLLRFKSGSSCLIPHSLRSVFMCLCTNGTSTSISMATTQKSDIVKVAAFVQSFIYIAINLFNK